MGPFLPEILLAALLALFVVWVWRKQEPRRPLRPDETDRYLGVIEAKFPMPDGMDKPALLARLRAFAEADDGRDLYMTNLLRYHEHMASGPAPAGHFTGAPAEANKIYERNTIPILLKSGAFPIFAGRAGCPNAIGSNDPADDNWSRILVVHYPSRRHFFNLLTNEKYLSKADFKSYAMYLALVPTRRELVVPEFRFLALVGALTVFLTVAWLHALFR